jgi:RTX calcium-binding nonapeptide repeat (4 copies)
VRTALAIAVLALVSAMASSASAHGIIRKNGDVLRYTAPDPGFGADLTISSPAPGTLVFSDPASPGGIDWGPCVPITEARSRCSTRDVSQIEIELYDGDDRVLVRASTPALVSAGEGHDRITGGFGADELQGGSGNDTLVGGEGPDLLNGSLGDDALATRDGSADAVTCGDGSDSLEHDPRDELPLTEVLACESRASAEPAPDTEAPRIELRAPARQRLARDGAVRGRVEASEPAALSLQGMVSVGRRTYEMRPVSGNSDAPGQAVTLRAQLGRAAARAVRRALRRGARVRARLTAGARDPAGNQSAAGPARTRLAR